MIGGMSFVPSTTQESRKKDKDKSNKEENNYLNL